MRNSAKLLFVAASLAALMVCLGCKTTKRDGVATGVVRVSVNQDGTVKNVSINRSTGAKEFDQAMLDTASRWKFSTNASAREFIGRFTFEPKMNATNSSPTEIK